jgi:hypothetical protein
MQRFVAFTTEDIDASSPCPQGKRACASREAVAGVA